MLAPYFTHIYICDGPCLRCSCTGCTAIPPHTYWAHVSIISIGWLRPSHIYIYGGPTLTLHIYICSFAFLRCTYAYTGLKLVTL